MKGVERASGSRSRHADELNRGATTRSRDAVAEFRASRSITRAEAEDNLRPARSPSSPALLFSLVPARSPAVARHHGLVFRYSTATELIALSSAVVIIPSCFPVHRRNYRVSSISQSAGLTNVHSVTRVVRLNFEEPN